MRNGNKFVCQKNIDKIAQEEAKIKHNQQKRLNIEKEKRDRLRELGDKANKLRNQMIMKAIFEVLKSQHDIKNNQEKLKKYLEYRDK